MALDPLTAEQLADQAAAHLAARDFGARLGAFVAMSLASTAERVQDAGGDPLAVVWRPAAAGLREVADWLDQGAP